MNNPPGWLWHCSAVDLRHCCFALTAGGAGVGGALQCSALQCTAVHGTQLIRTVHCMTLQCTAVQGTQDSVVYGCKL